MKEKNQPVIGYKHKHPLPRKYLLFFMGNSKMKAPSKKAMTQIVRGPHAAFPQTAKHCLHVVVWIKTLLSCLFPLLS